MAHLRTRTRKGGNFHAFVNDDGRETFIGEGDDSRSLVLEMVGIHEKKKRLARAGIVDDAPSRALWSLSQLKDADLQSASDRGLRTALPQPQGKASKRESHWKNLLAFFGDPNLDDVTETRIRAYIAHRQKTKVRKRLPGPATINRDLAVLREALELARLSAAAGYRLDPFRAIPPLEEASRRKKPHALSADQLLAFIRMCRELYPSLGAWVEQQVLTFSRPGQSGTLDGDVLRYEAHKRGIPRAFPTEGRLAAVLRERRAPSRRRWKKAVEAFGIPTLTPHHLRHSALTLAGKVQGETIDGIRKKGGWTTTAMVTRYLHPDDATVEPLELAPVKRRSRKLQSRRKQAQARSRTR